MTQLQPRCLTCFVCLNSYLTAMSHSIQHISHLRMAQAWLISKRHIWESAKSIWTRFSYFIQFSKYIRRNTYQMLQEDYDNNWNNRWPYIQSLLMLPCQTPIHSPVYSSFRSTHAHMNIWFIRIPCNWCLKFSDIGDITLMIPLCHTSRYGD